MFEETWWLELPDILNFQSDRYSVPASGFGPIVYSPILWQEHPLQPFFREWTSAVWLPYHLAWVPDTIIPITYMLDVPETPKAMNFLI